MIRWAISSCITGFYVFLCYLLYPLYYFNVGSVGKWIFRSFSTILLKVNRIRVTVKGAEHVDPSKRYFVTANHQSIFDIPILFYALNIDVRMFAKKELYKVPFFGPVLPLYNHVLVDRANKRDAIRSLKKARDVMKQFSFSIFPEGTRSRDGLVHQFKAGGVSLALRSDLPVLPVAIKGSGRIMTKGKLAVNGGEVTVTICPPFLPEDGIDKKMLAEKLEKEIRTFVE